MRGMGGPGGSPSPHQLTSNTHRLQARYGSSLSILPSLSNKPWAKTRRVAILSQSTS